MITVYPPQPIAVPAGASLEVAGQLQRCADYLERLYTELRVNTLITSQLGQPMIDDPAAVQSDVTLSTN